MHQLRLLLKALTLCGTFQLLLACATGLHPEAMAVKTEAFPGYVTHKSYQNNIAIGKVKGASETSPFWSSEISNKDFEAALAKSLQNFQYLAVGDSARYSVRVDFLEIDQSHLGFDVTVKTAARYILLDSSTKAEVYNEEIRSSFTATIKDASFRTTRLRIANERAVNINIHVFLFRLEQLGIENKAASVRFH